MDLSLVGLVLSSVPNRGLATLQAAAREGGLTAEIVPFGGFPDVERVAARLAERAPRVVGISLTTIESALATVVLVRRLRAHGHAGPVVLGGHFASLNAEALLRHEPGIDVVVRLAGQRALVALAAAPDPLDPQLLAELPGTVFRVGGEVRVGAPALPVSVGADGEVVEHLGFAAADVVISGGCAAHCAYCCIPAASDLAAAEARRAGRDPAAARHHRLLPETIGDRLAALHRTRGVRVVQLMDDDLLPRDPDEAAAFVRELHAALRARGVPDLAMTLQLRADAVSDASAEALAELGVVRAYVGIDGYTPGQLRVLGRAADPAAGPRAITLLRARGILAVVNALVVGPTVPFAVLEREVSGLAQVRGAPVHLLPHEVRAGTTLFRRAEQRGLVEGGYLHWHCRFADPRTERVARLLTSLPTRLSERSVPIALYDLAYNAGIARRLVPSADVSAALATFDDVTAAWNRDQLRVLMAALTASREAGRIEAWLAAEGLGVALHDRALVRRCDLAIRDVERAVERARGRPARAHRRGQILGAVALAMSVAGCNAPSPVDVGVDVPADVGADVAEVPVDAAPGDACVAGDPSQGLPFCDEQAYRLTFDAEGRVSDVALIADGAMLTAAMRDAILAGFAGHCYPSLAGTTQAYTSHCWIA